MIKIVDDLGAPALVAAVDIITTEKKPEWNKSAGLILAGVGYVLGGVMGIGGGFVKNLGIAAAPWAFESIYEWIRPSVTSRVSTPSRFQLQPASHVGSRIGSYPAPAQKPEFQTMPAF